MPSLGDSAFIFFLALLLFGPKKLPELARQLGKLMAEFRRASNEFKMQMEEELRLADQAEQQKKLAAIEAAAPATPAVAENTIANPVETSGASVGSPAEVAAEVPAEVIDPPEIPFHAQEPEPVPIASSGDLKMMPPSTGLPVGSRSVSHAFDSVPHVSDPDLPVTPAEQSFDPSEGHTPDAPDHISTESATEVTSHG